MQIIYNLCYLFWTLGLNILVSVIIDRTNNVLLFVHTYSSLRSYSLFQEAPGRKLSYEEDSRVVN